MPSGWVKGWGEFQRQNTVYVLFSHAHLKYLGNAAWLLAPAGLPLLAGFALVRRGRIASTPVTKFLAITSLSLVVGSCLVRPASGPFDWDMLSVTALFLVFFAGVLLSQMSIESGRRHLAAAVIALQFLFFGLPLSAIALGGAEPAGPFIEEAFPRWRPESPRRAPPKIHPWL
jgi:hypothetical protein